MFLLYNYRLTTLTPWFNNTDRPLQWAGESRKKMISQAALTHNHPFTAQPGGDAKRTWDGARASCQLSISGVITVSPSRETDGNSCSRVLPLNPSLSLPVWNTSSAWIVTLAEFWTRPYARRRQRSEKKKGRGIRECGDTGSTWTTCVIVMLWGPCAL